MFKSKLKPVAFLISILILSFVVGYLVFAWTEPASPPPDGNVDTPINVGTTPQAKAGRISATEFYDYNNPSYYVNPAGQSVLSDMKIGNFRFYPISATELGIYDSGGNLILILD
jgi:hypothetical protein